MYVFLVAVSETHSRPTCLTTILATNTLSFVSNAARLLVCFF